MVFTWKRPAQRRWIFEYLENEIGHLGISLTMPSEPEGG